MDQFSFLIFLMYDFRRVLPVLLRKIHNHHHYRRRHQVFLLNDLL